MQKLNTNASKILNITQHEKPIVYRPSYFNITGSKNAATLLYQILFWCEWNKGKFYKSDAQFGKMLNMTPHEFKVAKKTLSNLGFKCWVTKGFSPITYYCITDEVTTKIENELKKINSSKNQQLNQFSENHLTEDGDYKPIETINEENQPFNHLGEIQPNDDHLGEIKRPFGLNSTNHLGEIQPNVHYIQRLYTKNPTPTPSVAKEEGNNPHQGEERGLNQIDERELEQQTQEIMKIWESVPKAAGFEKVKSSLKIALTKKSFKAICEYATDYITAAVHSKQDLNYVSRAHTWLDKEMWPKSKIPVNYVPHPKSYQGYVPTASKPKTKEELLLGDDYFKSIKEILKENKPYPEKKELKVA